MLVDGVLRRRAKPVDVGIIAPGEYPNILKLIRKEIPRPEDRRARLSPRLFAIIIPCVIATSRRICRLSDRWWGDRTMKGRL